MRQIILAVLVLHSFLDYSAASVIGPCPSDSPIPTNSTMEPANFGDGQCYGFATLERQLLFRSTFDFSGASETEESVRRKLDQLYDDPNAQVHFNAENIRALSTKYPEAFKDMTALIQQRFESTNGTEQYHKERGAAAVQALLTGSMPPNPVLSITDTGKTGAHAVIAGTIKPDPSVPGGVVVTIEDSNDPGGENRMKCGKDGVCDYDCGWGSGKFNLAIMVDPILDQPSAPLCSGSQSPHQDRGDRSDTQASPSTKATH